MTLLHRCIAGRLLGTICALAGLLAALPAAAPAAGGSSTGGHTRTPIRHFLMLMQEGHSFDNYFGTYPGADGIPAGTCMPVDRRPDTPCVKPFRLGERSAGLPHSSQTFKTQFNKGAMDGFLRALSDIGLQDRKSPMGYYDAKDIPFYWNVADDYVLFDRFFASASGGSVMNHMYWLTGTPGDLRYPDAIPPQGFGNLPTIFDRLEEKKVSWKVYVQSYDPTITYRTAAQHRRATQATWMPLLSYARYIDDPKLSRHIVDLSELFTDADRGTLPEVAYVVPAESSEHPPGSISAGARLVRRITNALMLGPDWNSSAFMWTYDTWGGWYDHVAPPQVDRHGYGFRVPALLVSPWAKRGHVDHTQLDFTSALRFIESNWGLRPLARRDATAKTFMGAMDFSAGPRPPVILPLDRVAPEVKKVRRPIIYIGYGGAVVIAALIIGGMAARGSSRRQGRPWPPTLRRGAP